MKSNSPPKHVFIIHTVSQKSFSLEKKALFLICSAAPRACIHFHAHKGEHDCCWNCCNAGCEDCTK